MDLEDKNQNPAPKHSWHVVGAIFLCAVGIVLVSALAVGILYPRVIVITHTTHPQGTTTDYFGLAQTPMALPPLDTVAYDQKMLQLANLRIITVTTTTRISATSTATTTVTLSKTAPSPWPVKAAYPNAGALLPESRIVAYYGNFYSTQMGVLGEYPPAQVLQMLASTTAMWQTADPATPVIPALDYIAVTAQASAGPDGMYRIRMPASQINKAIDMAQQMNGVVFLDVQIGLSTVQKEIPLLEPYLKLPQVHLSLDPEFAMHGGERPGTVIGTMDAADINYAAQYLANLVRQNNLPPKILVIHRFTEDMVTNYKNIQPLPEVQIVMDMDGFGFPAKKINTYQSVIASEPVQFTGFKLFYKNDAIPSVAGSDHLMMPSEVLKLSPQPSYIQYQ
jgi:hypothetical protein